MNFYVGSSNQLTFLVTTSALFSPSKGNDKQGHNGARLVGVSRAARVARRGGRVGACLRHASHASSSTSVDFF